MISFTFETQHSVYWTNVTWCFVLLAALCCCNGLLDQKTLKMADPLQSASESSTIPVTTKQREAASVELGSLLDAGDGAVVTLVAGDTRLAAHKAVVAAGSPVIAAMIHPDTLEASSSEVNVAGVEGPVLRQLVAFMYTGRAPQLPGMAPQLLAAADRYGVNALRDVSEQQVLQHLDVETVAAAAVVAVRHSRLSLTKAAIAFIRAHTLEVLPTQGWAEAVLNNPREVVQIYHLLGEPPEETRTTTVAYSTATTTAGHTAAATATATSEDSMPTATIAPATTLTTTSATTSTTGSTPTPTAAGSTTRAATAHPHSDLGCTAPALQLPAACCYCPPVDAAAVSRFRGLPAEEKGRKLIEAAKTGSVPEVRALLAAEADVRARDGSEWTALHGAARFGRVEAAHSLLQAGAEVDAMDNWQWTPLHRAAAEGHTAVVRLLLAANADHDARDVRRWTPLHYAAAYGRAEVAAALLEAGADRGATTDIGKTTLDIAKHYKKPQLVQMLQ